MYKVLNVYYIVHCLFIVLMYDVPLGVCRGSIPGLLTDINFHECRKPSKDLPKATGSTFPSPLVGIMPMEAMCVFLRLVVETEREGLALGYLVSSWEKSEFQTREDLIQSCTHHGTFFDTEKLYLLPNYE